MDDVESTLDGVGEKIREFVRQLPIIPIRRFSSHVQTVLGLRTRSVLQICSQVELVCKLTDNGLYSVGRRGGNPPLHV